MDLNDLFEIGTIVNTHGIHGEIKLMPWTDTTEVFNTFSHIYIKSKAEPIAYKILQTKFHKNAVLLKLETVDTMSAAEALKGQNVYIERSALPKPSEDTYYIKDLIGLLVVTMDDAPFGEITDVFQTGSNDVYVVKTNDLGEVLIPAIKSVVKEINIEKSFVKIELIEGLI